MLPVSPPSVEKALMWGPETPVDRLRYVLGIGSEEAHPLMVVPRKPPPKASKELYDNTQGGSDDAILAAARKEAERVGRIRRSYVLLETAYCLLDESGEQARVCVPRSQTACCCRGRGSALCAWSRLRPTS